MPKIRKSDDFLVFGSPMIEEEDITQVVECMRSGWLGTGPRVAEFENLFSAYKGSENVAALNSCTAALHLSLLSAGIGPGDEVITTPLTFCATVNSIINVGATPVLADIDLESLNIDPNQINNRITKKTKAIIPVHFAGRPCEMDSIMEIAQKKQLTVIEDCAHAIETEYKGRKAGTIGDFGCFSFYSTKNIVTGEGGMVITKNIALLDKIKKLALHGMSKDAWKRFGPAGFKNYDVEYPGFKYNMMDLQAAIGVGQIRRVENYWLKRKSIWEIYMNELKDLPIKLPEKLDSINKHALHLFTIEVDKEKTGLTRDEFVESMRNEGIGTGVHYQSILGFSFYREKYGWKPEMCSNAKQVGERILSLPISAKLTEKDVNDVICAVKKILNK